MQFNFKSLPSYPSNVKDFTIDQKRTFVQDFLEFINENLHACDNAKVLPMAYLSNQSVILWGQGGFSKSLICDIFYEYLKLTNQINQPDPYIFAGSAGSTIEALNGGIDLALFQKTGKIEYLLDNSFAAHEFVVLEEAFQITNVVLDSLKQTLTAKMVCNGTQRYPLKTKMIVACTNKSKEDYVEDNNSEALIQRFQYMVNIEWTSYEISDYLAAVTKALKVDKTHKYWHLLTQVVWGASVISKKNIENGNLPVSPRTTVRAVDCVLNLGSIECLMFMEEFKNDFNLIVGHSSAITSTDAERLRILEKYELIEKMTPLTIVNNYKKVFEVMDYFDEETFEDGGF